MDDFYFKRALELAESRRGFCAPNPAVGAVLVRDGRILSEGRHFAAGYPHAEVEALADVPDEALRGSTLYVTLEPCCHHGRTPPCTDLLVRRGVSEVVYAYSDPNPAVSGKGHARLLAAGIPTRFSPQAEIAAFYRSYEHWTRTRLPYTTAKLALSLDGKTAGPGGRPLPLTGSEANRFTHERRLRSDVLLTTARTILADNPRLNARLHGLETPKPVVILDRLGRTPLESRIFETASKVRIFTGEDVPPERARQLSDRGAEVTALSTPQGYLPLQQVLARLGELGFHDLWVEGGAAVFSAFIKERLAQRAYFYVAPVLVGEGVNAFEGAWAAGLSDARITWTPQGRDVMAEVVW